MANWFVRINHRKYNKDAFFSEQAERKLYYDLDTKKDVLSKIKEDYPEYFSEKVPQRSVEGELFYVNVYELSEHWEAYWTEPVPCKYCGLNPVTRIDLKNNGHSNLYFCCQEHSDQYYADKFAEDTRTYREGELVGFIYKITQKETGRVYIGKTVNHPIFRWFQHFKAQSDSYFHEVMKDSDITDWTYEVIDVLKEGSGKDLLELESKYIAEYNATDREYGFNTKN